MVNYQPTWLGLGGLCYCVLRVMIYQTTHGIWQNTCQVILAYIHIWYIINHRPRRKWVGQASCYGLQLPIGMMLSHNGICRIQTTQMPMQLSALSLKEKWTRLEWLQHHREFRNQKWEQVNELSGHQYPGNSKWGGCIRVSHEGYHSRSVGWVVFFDRHEDLNLWQLHTGIAVSECLIKSIREWSETHPNKRGIAVLLLLSTLSPCRAYFVPSSSNARLPPLWHDL